MSFILKRIVRHVTCTIALSSLCFPAMAADKKPSEPRIAIIGAGASGLTTAYLLKKQGYRNVVVFEKADAVGGVAQTVWVKGKAYDMATMFVPGASISGDGIQPLLQEMIDRSKAKLVPAVDFETLNLPANTLSPLNTFHQSFEPHELKRQLLKGLDLMSQWAYCIANGIDSVTCGISDAHQPDESIYDWGQRLGIPAFTHLITYTADALGAGPSSLSNAPRGLAGGFYWTPVEVVRVLKSLGFGVNDLPPNTADNIVSLFAANKGKGSQRWWFFQKGYQTFWKKLVARERIRIKLSEPVTALNLVEAEGGRYWQVQTPKGSYEFDKVVAATTPRAAMHFLPDGPRKKILETAINRTPPNDVYLAEISGYDNAGLPEQAAWWPESLGLGSIDLLNPELGSAVKPFFWQKRHRRDVIFVGTYTLSPEVNIDQAYASVEDYARSTLGFELTKKIAQRRYPFPAIPIDPVSWSEAWSSLQGKDGLIFIGEAFTGSGVPAITAGLSQLVPEFFPVITQ
ncbi:FAD-dependent oxidoreductase [Pseudobacteriovorax antillogorgiicola]|nr:FAD-dependent oxidoreductase [Pseudobacteriovorax antillogorgiicola]